MTFLSKVDVGSWGGPNFNVSAYNDKIYKNAGWRVLYYLQMQQAFSIVTDRVSLT